MPIAILARVLGAIPVLFLVALVIFVVLRLAPGDAADLMTPDQATQEQIQAARELWGLDQPVYQQFVSFLRNSILLDFGQSYRYRVPVASLIAARLPATVDLASTALLLAVAAGIPLGMLAALRKDTALDTTVSVVAVAGVSAPSFWIGIILVLVFSGELHFFPSSGRLPVGTSLEPVTGLMAVDAVIAGRFALLPTIFAYLALPAATIALGMVGLIARIVRSAIIDTAQQEFVFTAVSKGLSRRRIIRRHLLPNAAIPIVTVVGLELGVLISGSIVVEVVFSWPGIGTLLYDAISVRDIPLVAGIVLTYTTIFILVNVLIDIVYFLIDPRLRTVPGR